MFIETTYEIDEETYDVDNLPKAVKPFLAYAPNGSVTSVNYKFFNLIIIIS